MFINDSRRLHADRERGIGIIEVMIGMLLGMLGVVVIFQVLSVSQRSQRATSASASVQVEGAIALYQLEQEILAAGIGTARVPRAALGCSIGVNDGGTVRAAIPLQPLAVTFGTASNPLAPDSLGVLVGGVAHSVDSLPVTSSSATESLLQSAAGVLPPVGALPGEVLLFAANDGARCELRSVTAVQTSGAPAVPTGRITHDGGRFRAVGAFTPGDLVMNLGRDPRAVTWRIDPTKRRLEMRDDLSGTVRPASDDVIDLQLAVAIDANDNNQIEASEWRVSGAIAAADLPRVMAIRAAMLTRTAEFEPPSPDGRPVTTAAPVWTGGAFDMENTLPVTGNVMADAWGNYRYRVYETEILLRNLVWNR